LIKDEEKRTGKWLPRERKRAKAYPTQNTKAVLEKGGQTHRDDPQKLKRNDIILGQRTTPFSKGGIQWKKQLKPIGSQY
jgi:hypothetical protein